MNPNRRDILLTTASALSLAAVPRLFGGAALAAGVADRYFVFCYFSGGWDILLSLDPRDPRDFRSELEQDTLIQPAYELLDVPDYPDPDILDTSVAGMRLGPFARPLLPWADRLAVVRGMSMETLTHDVGRRRFITGKPPSGLQARGSSITTHLAAEVAGDRPIPHLSARVEAYNVDRPSWASALKVDGVDDLVRALAPGASATPTSTQARIDALMDQVRDCPATGRSPVRSASLELRASARSLVSQGLDQRFDFSADTEQMQALRDHYGFSGGDAGSPEAQAAMAATALKAGISRCVSIAPASGLDTHYDNWQTDHGPIQERGFAAVAALAADLAATEYGTTGESWLDRTVIVGFSEFSRTALVNSTGGRDHSLTNACFLMGGGVRGGQVIGRSSDVGMSPVSVDLGSGQPDPGGEVVRPEHVHRALLVHAGVTDDVADLRVEPLTALFG